MRVKTVSEEPEVMLDRWGILVDAWGEPRLIGSPVGTRRGRISSAVQLFDLAAMSAITASGRVYRLIGKADHMNALAIALAMRSVLDRSGSWMTAEELAIATARPSSRRMN